jgi:asparagine N-glycosylation enzyme membrane subunit Stt3
MALFCLLWSAISHYGAISLCYAIFAFLCLNTARKTAGDLARWKLVFLGVFLLILIQMALMLWFPPALDWFNDNWFWDVGDSPEYDHFFGVKGRQEFKTFNRELLLGES